MQVNPFQHGDIEDIINFLDNNEKRLVYTISFFFLTGLVSVWIPVFRPIVAAAFLIIPLFFVIRLATAFDEQDYEHFSPVLRNIDDVRFLLAGLSFLALPVVSWYLDAGFGWTGFGTMGMFMIASSVGVFVWSEGTYVKNFYYDRWHPVERGLLFLSGILALLFGPVFVPLFLLTHKIITHQFDYPDIGGFMGIHSRLPLTILRIAGAFAFVCLFLPVQASQVTFLLFCGFSAHYFHPGFAKLTDNGPLYYLRNNNPFYLFLNAYAIGWMSFFDEDLVLRIGKYLNKIKLIFNLFVVLIEMGTIFLLLSHSIAVIVLVFTLTLQILISITCGVNFWKWIVIELVMLIVLVLIGSPSFVQFNHLHWFGLFVAFVILARVWMNPVGMSWLDSPYLEFYKFVGETTNGDKFELHPNVFRPYDLIITQGAQGSFTFLGQNPRVSFCLGGINDEKIKNSHEFIISSIYRDELKKNNKANIVENLGKEMQNSTQSRALADIITRFLGTNNGFDFILRYLSSPREFYTNGLSDRKSFRIKSNLARIQVYRIDGVWTNKGFQELHREEVLTIPS